MFLLIYFSDLISLDGGVELDFFDIDSCQHVEACFEGELSEIFEKTGVELHGLLMGYWVKIGMEFVNCFTDVDCVFR